MDLTDFIGDVRFKIDDKTAEKKHINIS